MADPKRARSWKRRIQPRIYLTNAEPVLYSTFALCLNAGDRIFSRRNRGKPAGILSRHEDMVGSTNMLTDFRRLS